MDYVHLTVQILLVSVGPVGLLLYWVADKTGAGWPGLLVLDLLMSAATAVDKNPWAALAFVLLFLRHLASAFKDWDRVYYEPAWLRETLNHDRVLASLQRPGLIADSPYRGGHRPEVIMDTGEIPRYVQT